MTLQTIKTAPCYNPRFNDYLMVSYYQDDKAKILILPNSVFIDISIEAGKRFKEIAPLAPYPIGFFGFCDWRCNNTIFQWVIKHLEQIYAEHYKHMIEAELEAKPSCIA